MNNSERKAEISVLTVLLCLLVIFIHVSSAPIKELNKDAWQYAVVFFPWRLSAFVVPGFIFLSGLKLFLNCAEMNYRKYYLSRIKRILIPYIIWNLIYYFYFISRGFISYSLSDLFVYLLRGNLVSPFYFVVIIAQFYALAPVWRMMVVRINPVFMLTIAAVTTLFLGKYLPEIVKLFNPRDSFRYTDRVFTTYLIYWVWGCYAGVYYQKFKALIIRHRFVITAAFLIVMLTEAILSYISFSGIKHFSWLDYVHYIYCISAVLFLFTLFTWLYQQRSLRSRLIKAIDAASYDIYLMHCLFIYIIDNIMANAGIYSISSTYLIRIVFVYSCAITVSILWNRGKRGLYGRCRKRL